MTDAFSIATFDDETFDVNEFDAPARRRFEIAGIASVKAAEDTTNRPTQGGLKDVSDAY